MKFPDMLRTAFLNLWRRKLRAFLTVLGMVIGTSSIVVMVSLGVGMRQSMIESYASMGSLTNITVSRWSYKETATGGTNTEKKLDKTAVETIKKIPGVKAVMPQIQTYGILYNTGEVNAVTTAQNAMKYLDEKQISLSRAEGGELHAIKNFF